MGSAAFAFLLLPRTTFTSAFPAATASEAAWTTVVTVAMMLTPFAAVFWNDMNVSC